MLNMQFNSYYSEFNALAKHNALFISEKHNIKINCNVLSLFSFCSTYAKH